MSAVVLLVEDEESLCGVEARALEKRGYRVLCAPSAEEARTLLENNPVDLVVADIVLPGQGGLDFMLERKSHENGGPRFLFTSGKINVAHASFRMIAEQFGDVRALQKPFTVEEFLAAVDGALSGPPQA
ncbi:MAG: response regulator [Spirochaetes bacterium]|uniref:Response regulator n=1 Tax=Candidatus Avitreponema avistercoris TaxID=2840705 RepID=A0A9D9EQG6_9SPIR|nr:response regulator [Candidatus Avitreponema avistercoris]